MLTTRELTLRDSKAMTALDRLCFEYDAWSLEQMKGSLALPTTQGRAVCDQGKIIAFYLVQRSGDETEILTLCTHPKYRRRKIGLGMLRDLIERQEEGTVFLEVAKDNQAAINLYEQAGFSLFGRRPRYYVRDRNRVDALSYRYLVKAS